MNNDLFYHTSWNIFSFLGLNIKPLLLFEDTIIYTWITIAVIVVLCLLGRYALTKEGSAGQYIALYLTEFFVDMAGQGSGTSKKNYAYLIGSFFMFIFVASALVVLPFCEEPTKDLNTTIALALCSFFYVQTQIIQAKGAAHYFGEFVKQPIPYLKKGSLALRIIVIFFAILINIAFTIAMLPLEILGKITSTISLAFRLFGNIFGGSVIASLWAKARGYSIIFEIVGMFGALNIIIMLFFGLFESFIQAYVFSILSATYIGIGITSEEEEDQPLVQEV